MYSDFNFKFFPYPILHSYTCFRMTVHGSDDFQQLLWSIHFSQCPPKNFTSYSKNLSIDLQRPSIILSFSPYISSAVDSTTTKISIVPLLGQSFSYIFYCLKVLILQITFSLECG